MSSHTNPLQLAQKRRQKFRKLLAENETYPVATITYHGPDDQTPTKISVGIVHSKKTSPLVKHWEGKEIGEDIEVAQEISQFIKEHKVQQIITSKNVMSCPHEEGIDYPEGETCPECSFWAQDS